MFSCVVFVLCSIVLCSLLGVIPCSVMRDTSGAIGSCVADIALLDHVVTGAPLVQLLKSGSLAGKKVAVVEDWIAFKTGGKGVGDTVLRSLEVTKAAFAKAGAEVLTNLTGFTEMALTNKDTWELPFLPVPHEDSCADLQAYLNRHVDRPASIQSVADITAKMDSKGIIGYYAPLDEEKISKLPATAEGIVALEASYREWFAKNGVSVAMIPFCGHDLTKIDIAGEGGANFVNEYGFCMHMNEIHVPSIAIPIHSVKHEGSGVPCSVLLYGVDDAEVLAVAMALEAALKV